VTTPHHGIVLFADRCTSCMICARECPTWCIAIDSHTEPLPGSPPGPRQRTRAVLDAFTLDWALCLYCGICIEECPFDALAWSAEHPAAAPTASGLVSDMIIRGVYPGVDYSV